MLNNWEQVQPIEAIPIGSYMYVLGMIPYRTLGINARDICNIFYDQFNNVHWLYSLFKYFTVI